MSTKLFSEYLRERGGIATNEGLKAYTEHIQALQGKSSITDEEQAFTNDYLENIVKAKMASDKGASSSKPDQPKPQLTQVVKMSELVITPDKFDGKRHQAQRWLDSYERAAIANDWYDATKVKYLPSFLTRAGLDWYDTMAQPKINQNTNWTDVRAMFSRYFVGESDGLALQRQIQNTYQNTGETASAFTTRLLRLLMLMNSNMPEIEKVNNIICRLRSEYQEQLCRNRPITVEELNDNCIAVENGIRAAKAAASIRRSDGPRVKTDDKQKSFRRGTTSASGKPQTKYCTRCERNNHTAANCFASKKKDGSELKDKPPKKVPSSYKKVNAAVVGLGAELEDQTDEQAPEIKTLKNLRICQVNRYNVPLLSNDEKPIVHPITLNGEKLKGFVDTGSKLSLISAELAAIHGWNPTEKGPELASANNQQMNCMGQVELDLSITIGNTTKQMKTKFVVLDELCVSVLLGRQLLQWLKVVINASSRTLSFEREPKSKTTGLRLSNSVILPPRSQKIVQAKSTIVGIIQTIPFNFGASSILVANSISQVEKNSVDCLVANLGPKPVEMPENLQIACSEPVEKPTSISGVVVPIEGTKETFKIGDDLNDQQINQLVALINGHKKAFAIGGELGCTNEIEHDIELVNNAQPRVEPLRRRPKAHQDETRRQVQDLLKKQIIVESSSPWAHAYVLAKKKNGEMRLCIDFRRLNDLTKKCVYPLPHVEECIESLAGKKYFSQLDMASGFWQIPLSKRARELTAFRTEDGLFEFTRMPFGLTNAPASFQRMVNALFAGLRGLNFQVFIDDLCIATATWTEHLDMLEQIFKLIIQANLKLRSDKCVFGARKIIFLGHEISENGIRQEPDKLRAMIELPIPTNAKEVQRALGFFNYYRKFVPRFSIIAEPLSRLTRKNAEFGWTTEQATAWRSLLDQLAKKATLAHFNYSYPTVLKTDACKVGVAGILLQQDPAEGEWLMVSCCSRRLTPSEQNYAITDLEGLAAVYAITKFRHYLLGIKFKLVTDHCALCALKTKMPNSARLKRWAIILSEYNFEVTYTSGAIHKDVDCLSRAPVENEIDHFLDDRIMVIASKSRPMLSSLLVTPVKPGEWTKLVEQEAEAKPFLSKARQRKSGFKLRNQLLYKDDKLYVPAPKRNSILRLCHSDTYAAHGGIQATMDRLSEFWWPSICRDATRFVETCVDCQKCKQPRALPSGSMRHHVAHEPFERLAIDCLGPLPASLSSKKHVMVAIDSFTRFVYAKAIKDLRGSTTKKFLLELFGRFGVPTSILTDNASNFCNEQIRQLAANMRFEHVTTTPHHHQSNAQVERVIQTIRDKLNLLASNAQTAADWEEALPVITLAINTTIHSSTNYSPFELLFGKRQPLRSDELMSASGPIQIYAELAELRRDKARVEAIARQSDAQAASRSHYEQQHVPRRFEIEDLVLARVMGRRNKLSNRYQGPYRIISSNNDIYQLELLENAREKLERHVGDIKHYKQSSDGNPGALAF